MLAAGDAPPAAALGGTG